MLPKKPTVDYSSLDNQEVKNLFIVDTYIRITALEDLLIRLGIVTEAQIVEQIQAVRVQMEELARERAAAAPIPDTTVPDRTKN